VTVATLAGWRFVVGRRRTARRGTTLRGRPLARGVGWFGRLAPLSGQRRRDRRRDAL